MLSVVAMALVETDLPDDASTPISESTHGQPIMQRAVQAFERLRDRTTAAAQSELPFTPDTEPGVDMEDGEGAVVADADADASRALSLQQHKTASTAVAAWSRRAHTGADWLAGIGDAELRSVELHPVETASRQPPTRRGRDIQRKSVIAGIAPPTGVRTRAHSDWDDVRKALNVVVACRPLSHVCVCVFVQFASQRWVAERARLAEDTETDAARTQLAKYILLKCMRSLSTGDALLLHLRAAQARMLDGVFWCVVLAGCWATASQPTCRR